MLPLLALLVLLVLLVRLVQLALFVLLVLLVRLTLLVLQALLKLLVPVVLLFNDVEAASWFHLCLDESPTNVRHELFRHAQGASRGLHPSYEAASDALDLLSTYQKRAFNR